MDLLNTAGEEWTHENIRRRTDDMISAILEIWPVPAGHVSSFARAEQRPRHKIEISDLMGAGLLNAGDLLYPRQAEHQHRVVTVLPDGRLEVEGHVFGTPSGAAVHIVGGIRNGWTYFFIDVASRKLLNALWYEYVDMTSAEADESDLDDDDNIGDGLDNGQD
jgi:hypothetical protein